MAASGKSVVVLGGGVSGMAISRQLALRGMKVTCIEQADRFGGWISSKRTPSGILFEQGPHSLRPRAKGNGLRVVQLLQELGLESEALLSEGTDRYVWARSKMIRLPGNLREVFTNPLTRKLPIRVVLEALVPPPGLAGGKDDMTIGDFVGKKFGKDAKLLVSAMVAGVFAGNADTLSVKSCFPDLVRFNQQGKGSLVRGMLLSAKNADAATQPEKLSPLAKASGITFREGMGRLAQQLEAECTKSGVAMIASTTVDRLEHAGSKWRVFAHGGNNTLETDLVVSTLSPAQLSTLLQPRVVPELENLKATIGKVDVAVVNLAYDSQHVHLAPRGFGHLVAEKQVQSETGCLGVIYDSNAFPRQQPDGITVFSVMLGGANAPWISQKSEEELIALAKTALRDHLHIRVKPLESAAVLHRNCIPQYGIGHSTAARRAREILARDNLIAFGTGLLGAGIADSIGGALREIETSPWAI